MSVFGLEKYKLFCIRTKSRENQVFIVAPNEDRRQVGAYTVEELPDVISNLAHETDIYDVKIAGGTKYSQIVEYGVETLEMVKYKERKIKIEVI